MFRSLLCAAGLVLALSTAGSGVALAADTGPDSQACKDATSAAAQAQVDVDAAQKAYDDSKANGSTTNSALQQLLDTLNAKKANLQTKLATKTPVCAGSPPSTSTTPPPPPGNHDTYGSCAAYNAHGIYAIPRSDPRYRVYLDRDHDGLACEHHEGTFRNGHWYDDKGVVISDDGNCVTYVDDNRNYGLRYRGLYDSRAHLLDLARRADSDGGTRVTDAEWRSIRLHDGELVDDWNHYRTSSDELKTVCKQNPVVVVNNPPADFSSSTSTSSNGNPVVVGHGGGQVSEVPVGPAETGDGSTPAPSESARFASGVAFAALMAPVGGLLAVAWDSGDFEG